MPEDHVVVENKPVKPSSADIAKAAGETEQLSEDERRSFA